MYSSQIIYSRIDEMVKKLNKSMEELNQNCNLSKNTVSQSARSQEGMKAQRLYAIAEFLDCSIDYLFGRTDNPKSHKEKFTNTVTGSYNVVDVDNSSVTLSTPILDEHQKLLIELYNKLSPIEQVELIAKLNTK